MLQGKAPGHVQMSTQWTRPGPGFPNGRKLAVHFPFGDNDQETGIQTHDNLNLRRVPGDNALHKCASLPTAQSHTPVLVSLMDHGSIVANFTSPNIKWVQCWFYTPVLNLFNNRQIIGGIGRKMKYGDICCTTTVVSPTTIQRSASDIITTDTLFCHERRDQASFSWELASNPLPVHLVLLVLLCAPGPRYRFPK